MAHCFQLRGCDVEMAARCPHATASIDGMCTLDCTFAVCISSKRLEVHDNTVLFDKNIIEGPAIKQTCWSCQVYVSAVHSADISEKGVVCS